MRHFFRVGLSVAAITVPLAAQAADIRTPIYKAPPSVAVYNWTGCYLGGQIGSQSGGWTAGVSYPTTPAVVVSRDFGGDGNFIYGGQIGCNWQPTGGYFVVGLEGDLIGRSQGEFDGEIYRFATPTTDHFNTSGHYGSQSSLRLRLGIALDRLLLYVAGGASWANISSTHYLYRDGDGSAQFSTSATRNGSNIGIGGEYAFANWTVGLEYRYTRYGSLDYNIPAGTAGTLTWLAHSGSIDDLHTQDIRLRFNYLFNAGPVYARY